MSVLFSIVVEQEVDGRWIAEVIELPACWPTAHPRTRRLRAPKRSRFV